METWSLSHWTTSLSHKLQNYFLCISRRKTNIEIHCGHPLFSKTLDSPLSSQGTQSTTQTWYSFQAQGDEMQHHGPDVKVSYLKWEPVSVITTFWGINSGVPLQEGIA